MRDSWHHFHRSCALTIGVVTSKPEVGRQLGRFRARPYPVGNVSAQPDQRFAFPDPAAGARDVGDKLHPNRAGYLAMGMVIDLDLFRPKQQR
jgi:hypothetical protein